MPDLSNSSPRRMKSGMAVRMFSFKTLQITGPMLSTSGQP